MEERLQKIVAHAGIASRRKVEEMILAGRVSVNGEIVSVLGAKADPARDTIAVDGKRVAQPERLSYWLFHKPRQVVSTLSDPEHRPSLADYLRTFKERLYPVGRLDYHSEGLLLLTNDGELTHRITHASSHFPKTYWVKVSGRPSEEQLERLRKGVPLDGKRTAPCRIQPLRHAVSQGRRDAGTPLSRTSQDNPWFEVILIEGRQNQIRNMFALVGHPVEKLKRIAIGWLQLGNLLPGKFRELTQGEITRLRRTLDEPAAPAGSRDAGKPARPTLPPRKKRVLKRPTRIR